MKKVTIHGVLYRAKHSEFKQRLLDQFKPMIFLDGLRDLSRWKGLLFKLSRFSDTIVFNSITHGGYLAVNIGNTFKRVIITDTTYYTNIKHTPLASSKCIIDSEYESANGGATIAWNVTDSTDYTDHIIIINDERLNPPSSFLTYTFLNKYIYVSDKIKDEFVKCLDSKINYKREIYWDNLVHLLFMVKDAGPDFKDVLLSNIPYADKLTVLDTGSTDGTQDTIRSIFKSHDIDGCLYERKWKNFRDNRNELLDLAGDGYSFNVMLDDTYTINGRLREFLQLASSDIAADSYSLFIKDDFYTYGSNRVTIPSMKLRYVYPVHEIIEKNKTFQIPFTYSNITDRSSPYMATRTSNRKKTDLVLLMEEYNRTKNPRQLYYIAETYMCMSNMECALEWYTKRSESSDGFGEEIQDSLYKIATISYFNIGCDVNIAVQLYLNCWRYDKSRPEALYMIGWIYKKDRSDELAYLYLKKAMDVNRKAVKNAMNDKMKIKQFDLPNCLLEYCILYKNYELGLECSTMCSEYKGVTEVSNYELWKSMFWLCDKYEKIIKSRGNTLKKIHTSKIVVIVAPGGWQKWDGSHLTKKGLGGSETFCVKYAEYFKRCRPDWQVIVFCDCEKDIVVDNVNYRQLVHLPLFISTWEVHYCMVNRYPEYLPMCYDAGIKNVSVVFHDLCRHGELLVDNSSLSNIFCLTNWHKSTLESVFPMYKHKIDVVHYGVEDTIDTDLYTKTRHSFIFASFPNRGLLPLLKLWPSIIKQWPDAELNVFCDLNHKWVKKYHNDQLIQIKKLISQGGVTNHGWVTQTELRKWWRKSHIWLYPCIFEETYCRLVLDAAESKTLMITSDLGALKENVTGKGIVVYGNANTKEWGDNALKRLFETVGDAKEQNILEKSYKLILEKKYEKVAEEFISTHIDRG